MGLMIGFRLEENFIIVALDEMMRGNKTGK